jgi:hypothetical protein
MTLQINPDFIKWKNLCDGRITIFNSDPIAEFNFESAEFNNWTDIIYKFANSEYITIYIDFDGVVKFSGERLLPLCSMILFDSPFISKKSWLANHLTSEMRLRYEMVKYVPTFDNWTYIALNKTLFQKIKNKDPLDLFLLKNPKRKKAFVFERNDLQKISQTVSSTKTRHPYQFKKGFIKNLYPNYDLTPDNLEYFHNLDESIGNGELDKVFDYIMKKWKLHGDAFSKMLVSFEAPTKKELNLLPSIILEELPNCSG